MSTHRGLGPRARTALLSLCREAIQAVRVSVVATYPTVRAGLSALVCAQEDWTVMGEMAPGALLRADGSGPISDHTDPPDVVLADLDGAEDSDAIDAWLDALRPQRGVVVLGSAQSSNPSPRQHQEALRRSVAERLIQEPSSASSSTRPPRHYAILSAQGGAPWGA
jgi:hypothetical protein